MSDFLQIVGFITVAVIGSLVLLMLYQIAGNIYGGIKGAYRLKAIRGRGGAKKWPHRHTVLFGLRSWAGERYKNGYGSYFRVGGLRVPVDGRDPIERDRFYGA